MSEAGNVWFYSPRFTTSSKANYSRTIVVVLINGPLFFQVHDSKILSRAKQTLPKFLDVETLADGSTTVISNALIEQGTQFGPFQSPLSIDLHPSIMFPLKVTL